MSGFLGQVRALPANAFVRSSPDPAYADGDDSTWTTVDWPSLTRTELVLGRRVRVIYTGTPAAPEGSAPPLLFIHGLGGLWQNWLLNIPAFMGSHRVIAPDLPGFGGSEMPAGRISIQGFARVIDALCDRLDISSPVVIGNSMGGFIGTELAINDPERVDELVLVSAAGITWARARQEPARMMARVGRAAAPLLLKLQTSGIRRPGLRRAAFQGVFFDPLHLRREALWENFVPAMRSPGYYDAMSNLFGYDITHRLEEIGVPTLIVWGRNDRVVPVPAALSYKKRIGENAELVIFDRCGHVPQIERPVRFNRVLEKFLAREGVLG